MIKINIKLYITQYDIIQATFVVNSFYGATYIIIAKITT